MAEEVAMSPRYGRLIGSLARVDGDLAAELDQGTVLVALSPASPRKLLFGDPRKKPAVPRQSPRRQTAATAAAATKTASAAAAGAGAAEESAKQPSVLDQLEKAKTLRNLDDAKRRHERLVHGLSCREEEMRAAIVEAEQSPRPARQRIRQHPRERWAPDSQLTPRQQKLLAESSRDLPPGTYATTAVCFKCGLTGHTGSECTKPTLGPKQLRTTQVMLTQRKAAEAQPPDSTATAPLYAAAKSPRKPRLRDSVRAPRDAIDTPPKPPVVKEEIEREIERLKAQLDDVMGRETMYEAVEQLQTSLGKLDRTAPKMAQMHGDKWEDANLPDEYEDLHEQLAQADGEPGPQLDYKNSGLVLKERRTELKKRGVRKKAIMQRGTTPQLYNRTELGKSQPLDHVVGELEDFDGSPSQDPGWQPPQDELTIAVQQAGYAPMQADIEARLKRLKKAMAFPNVPKTPEPEPEPEPEQASPTRNTEPRKRNTLVDVTKGTTMTSSLGRYYRPAAHQVKTVRDPVTAVFAHPSPLGLQLAPAAADCIVILAINEDCGVNASGLEGLRVGHELLKINGRPVHSRHFDDVISELAAYGPSPDKPLVLDFGLTGLHLLPGAGAVGEDPDDSFKQPVLPEQHEFYRGALDEGNEYDVAGKHGDAGLSLELGVDTRLAELEVTIDAISNKDNPARTERPRRNHKEYAEAKSSGLAQYRKEMYDGSESGWDWDADHERTFPRPHYYNTHLPGTHRPPQPMAYATHDQLGSWGEDAAERAMQQELDLQNRIEAGVDRHSHSHSDRRGAVRDRGDEGSDDDDGDDDDQQERDRQRVSLLEEAFKAFDVDGDDYMTWDEFYAAFLKKRMLDDRRFLKLSRDEIRSIYDAMPNVVPSAEFAGVPYLCPAHPVRAKFVDFSGYVSFTTATNADKRKKAAAAGEKTFRQYDPAVEGGVGFEGLLDADGGIGPNKAFDIPPDGVQEEERWPMPQRINNRRPTLRFPSKEKMNELWKKHDYNGNGLLSQSEAKEVLEELWPALARNTKTCDAVLRMAYNACDDGCGDGLVDRKEFPTMLEYVQYFSRMFSVFSEIDESGDGNIELSEFYEGCKAVGLTISDEQAEIEFQSIDEDGGGYVSFMEFCAWVAKKQMGGWHRAKVVATASMAADAAAEAGRSHQGDERGEGGDGEMMAALGGTALAPKGADADAATTISSTKAAATSTDGLSKGQAEVQKVLSQQASNLKQVVCWNCRQPGHTAAYCPEARMVGTNRDRNKLKLSTTIHSHRLAQKRQEAAQSVAVQHAKEQARQKLFENDVERDFAALQNHPAAAARVPATAATRETTRVIRGALHR